MHAFHIVIRAQHFLERQNRVISATTAVLLVKSIEGGGHVGVRTPMRVVTMVMIAVVTIVEAGTSKPVGLVGEEVVVVDDVVRVD